jgi:hypothetical protein
LGSEIFVEIGAAVVWGREFNGEEAGRAVLGVGIGVEPVGIANVAVVWGVEGVGIAVIGVGLSKDAVGIIIGAGEWEERSMRPVGKEIVLEVGVCVFVGLRCGAVRSGTEAGTKTDVSGH